MNISQAYAECEAITRREARNFSYGIRLLPPPKRRALSAVYAAARRIDDVGDGPLPSARKLAQLAEIRERIEELREGPPRGAGASDAVLVALADAARRYPIPLEAFDELLEGCEADVRGRQYKTFADLEWYCRSVAGSVGRLSLGVFDPADHASAAPLADALGIALQLTNILRDLREDRWRNRVYLPVEDLDRFGCRLDIDTNGRLVDPPGFAKLVRFQAERAESWYARGLALLPYLDRRSRACTAAMAGIYHRLLVRIRTDPDVCRTARVALAPREKVAVAVRALVWGDA